ncbi:hypothetical protein PENCOP_c015G08808 [Penicillium coprophilum]|uniref:Uncharacterized protein n=1 Tax=Penicillium coprophilum TaxID=36646 RepID=A0A1V6U8J7_9EURO|nr:hypothetical protein PENCOP_c015G08808 [Penicillium coprophilum]
MPGNHDTTDMGGRTTSRAPITQSISGVSAKSGAKVFAGYVDSSNSSEYYGGTHYHQLPERVETPPAPLLTVPFRRDADFVDRGTLLDLIHEKASAPGARIALVGIGGVSSRLDTVTESEINRRRPGCFGYTQVMPHKAVKKASIDYMGWRDGG